MNILINESRIEKRLNELAKAIDRDYEGKEVTLLGVLKGSVVFMVELAKRMKTKVKFEFIEVSFDEEENGRVNKFMGNIVEGKNILIVEDIIDTGKTLTFLKQYLLDLNPASLKIVTLLCKPSITAKELNVDYTGFGINDQFVLGYGMDYNGFYRNLPYIAYME